MESSTTFPAPLTAAISRLSAVSAPNACPCAAGCRRCCAEVRHSDASDERSVTVQEFVGLECECGERCTEVAYLVNGPRCSLTCAAFALIYAHDDAQDDSAEAHAAVVAAIEAELEARQLARLNDAANEAARYLNDTRMTVRPGVAA